MKLRQYQNDGVEFLAARRYALLADDPGLGKTAQAIGGLVEIGAKKILIICPAQVKYNWKREFNKWAPGVYSIGIIDKSTDPLPKTQVVIVNYDLIIRDKLFEKLKNTVWDCIINDEAHRLKKPTSSRTKKILGKWGLFNIAKKMWFLTGTPVTSRPIDLFPLIARCLGDKFAPNNKYLGYAYRYCGAYQGRFGLVVSGATHLEELRDKLNGFLLRRRKKDVLKELPQRIITHIEFDCTPEVQRAIEREEEETAELAGGRDPEHYKIGEISRIRRAVAKHKLKDSVGFIEDRLEEDKVVVFFYHKDVCKYLQEAFREYKPLTIDGSVPAKKRMELVDKFIKDDTHRLFLGQMEAAGEGIDGLQHASSTCIFVEPSWLPKDMDQCISRLERIGQENPVNAYFLTIKNTIESKMMKLLEWKLQNINVILNDDQTLKQTKQKVLTDNQEEENEMAKETTAITTKRVYLEDKVDMLVEGMTLLLQKVNVLTALVEAKPAAMANTAKPKPVAAVAGPNWGDSEPEETESANVKSANVTSEDVRKLAGAIAKADPINGKAACVKVIEGVAGKGKKLADCTPAQLQEVGEQFAEIVNA